MSFFKDNPVRSKKYLKWIDGLDCCLCHAPADTHHHIIGIGDGIMGGKACDLLSMPVCTGCHALFHRQHENPELKLEQWEYVAKTLQKAIKDGIIKGIKVA